MVRNYGRRRSNLGNIINSEKHIIVNNSGITTTNADILLAKAVTAPSNTVVTDCHRGGLIKAMWFSLSFCGLASTGTTQQTAVNLMKNPGDNLTAPGVFAVGSSNEKKFVFKQWHAMTMRNQDGNNPYHWEGWVKIPKRYQRMGTDDVIEITNGCTTATGHFSLECIYKEYF